jgi:hypothetical protein
LPLLPDVLSFDELGGVKTDYIPVIDPTTDLSALNLNLARDGVAQMSRTALRGWIRFATAATSGAMVLSDWETTWKADVSTLPVLARSTAGVFTLTLPASVLDALGNTHTINLRAASVSAETFPIVVAASISSANVITVHVGTGSTLSDQAGTIVMVQFA